MFLQKIEIYGFKSFCKKSVFNFRPGISGIVGPNGCGKSNIVDSMRWVMGEQNPKFLRGDSQDDIIFSGSQANKPLNYAEVSVTFQNDKGDSPPEYINHHEIVLTRRIFRTGQKEYFINKVPCRLKDITNFFMSSGLGARTYAIIAQGQVEQIVQARPEELRLMLEDAANISVYRNKIKETEKILEKTVTNLGHVQNILLELEGQKKNLQVQVDKANRFKELRKQKEEAEMVLMAFYYNKLHSLFKRRKKRLLEIDEKQDSFFEQMAASEEQIKQLKEEVAPLSEKVNISERESDRLGERIHSSEERLKLYEGRIKDNSSLEAKLTKEIEQLNDKLSNYQGNLDEMEANVYKQEDLYETEKEKLEELQDELNELTYMTNSEERQVEELQKSLSEGNSFLIKQSSELSHQEDNFGQLSEKVEQVKEELTELDQLLQSKNERILEVNYDLDEKNNEKDRLVEQQQQLKDQLTELSSERKKLESDLHDLKSTSVSIISRLEALQEIDQKNLFSNEKRDHTTSFPFVSDYLEWSPPQDLIENEDLLTGAIQQSHSLLEVVIVEKESQLEELRQIALANERVIKCICVEHFHKQSSPELPADCMTFADCFKTEGPYDEMIKSLLQQVIVSSASVDGVSNSNLPLTTINLDGDILHNSGIWEFGKNQQDAELLKRRKEIKLLQQRKNLVEEDVSLLEDKLDGVFDLIANLESEVEGGEQPLSEIQLEIISLEKDLGRLEIDIEKDQIARDKLDSEVQASHRKHQELETLIESLKQSICEKEQENQTLELSLTSIQEELREKLEARKVLGRSISEKQVNLATLKENYESKKRELEQLSENIDDWQGVLEEKERECQRLNVLNDNLNADVFDLKTEIAGDIEQKKEEENFVVEHKQRVKEMYIQLEGLEVEYNKLRMKHEKSKDAKTQLQLDVSETSLELKHMEESAREKYDISILDTFHELLVPNYKEEQGKKQITQLQFEIDQLGPVNLLAVNDYNKIVERYDFNVSQKEDIENTMQQLEEAIKKTRQDAKRKFFQTFDKVNAHFKELFPILFPGGSVELTITNREEVLESGVEIHAQLPGKKMTSLSLFSGGEKALTAICLIFSLLKTNPTSFCFLDEVDAPLDEANVERYNQLLKSLSSQFQFILITHNKRTVEVADDLFGITMQEKGISKVVSVELNR